MISNEFIIELAHIKYDKAALIDYVQSYGNWKNEGFINDYFRPKEYCYALDKICEQLQHLGISSNNIFFAELQSNIFLFPHRDVGRTAAINIPLLGNFEKTPIMFFDSKQDLIFKYYYNDRACIVNTQQIHGVKNITQYRCILSISLNLSWNILQSKDLCGCSPGRGLSLPS